MGGVRSMLVGEKEWTWGGGWQKKGGHRGAGR